MIFKEPALNIKDKLVEFRRDFHMHPEASFCEERTNAVIRKFLEDNGIEIQEVGAGYSVVGVIRGGKPGKTFALRADIDALPMPELNDVPYKSQNEGVMHACGHDAHTASLMGVALLINEVKDQMSGNVKLLFQAAEEKIPGGAKELVEKGALENPYVDAVMGFHVANALPVGYVAFGAGPGAAASDTYKFRIIGKGGHGAYPHATIDPVVISAYFITSLQTIVSRNVEPVQGAVITIGSIHGGTKENIIADDVEMLATVRSLDEDVRALLHKRIQEICKATEAMYGCKVEWELEMGYPVLAKWQMRGSNAGRSFTANTCATASVLNASAPRPYTVSVGRATNPPSANTAAASLYTARQSSNKSTSITRVSMPASYTYARVMSRHKVK